MSLSLAMIVKGTDEEALLLDKCLASVADYVDQIVIVNTRLPKVEPNQAVRDVALKYHASVLDFEWIDDFAAARNFAFKHATCDWILWLDADDTVQKPELLRQLIDQPEQVDGVALEYYYDIDDKGVVKTKHWRERIVRNNDAFTWKGRLHEILSENRSTNIIKNNDVKILHSMTDDRHKEALARNISILEQQLKDEEATGDPRTMYYLATAYIDAGLLKDAEKLLNIYLTYSGWDEERCQAQCQLATIKTKLDKENEAEMHYLAAIKEFPQNPVPYVWLGHLYSKRQLWNKALAWLEMALQKPDPSASSIVWNTLEYTYLPLALYAEASLNAGKIDQALNAAKKAKTFSDDTAITEMIDIVTKIKGNQLATQSFIDLARFLQVRDENDKTLALLNAVPKDLADNPMILSLKRQFTKAKVWPKKSIVIYCGESAIEAWGPWSLADGIGGSEEAVIRLSKHLVEQGYTVCVYASPGTRAGVYDGVEYKNSWEFDIRDTFDIFCSWRSPWIFDAKLKARKSYLWLHDVIKEGELTPGRISKIERIIVLSEYHRSLFPNIADDKFLISANGIDAAEFDGVDIKRDRNQIIYTSSHTRGLIHLLDIWPSIKVRVPEAHLELFYGWDSYVALNRDNPERMDWMDKVKQKIEALDGVTDHGKVSQQIIVEETLKSAVWAYPTLFPEISCITAMKMQAGGAVPVVNNFAALKETVKWGDKANFSEWNKQTSKEYEDLLVNMLTATERQKGLREEMMAGARDVFSWSNVAKQWVENFED